MNIYKILPVALAGTLIAMSIAGCGKKEESNEKEYNKTIVCSDFTSYDITRRIVEGTDIAVEGIDFSQIDWEKGISGRDRSKINKSMLFVNGTWMDESVLGELDENLNKIQLKDFAEKKENTKDSNKLYTGISLNISSSENEKNENSSDSKRPQVIVNPNAEKNDNNKNDNDKNENNSNNGSNTGNENNGNGSIQTNSENSSEASASESDWSSGDWNNNNNSESTEQPKLKDGIRMYFCESSYSAPPCGADRQGYSLGNFPVGTEIENPSVNPDPYHVWICDRIRSMNAGTIYYILDNGNGTYTILNATGWLMERYEVVATVDDIYISSIDNSQNVACEPSTRSMLGAYSDCFMEGLPNGSQAKANTNTVAEDKIMLANTVDFAKGIWLDVKNTRVLAENIKNKLVEIDPTNKERYEENYKKVDGDLASLNDKYQLAVDSSENKTIFIGGAFVYKYMTDAYGIDYVSIYDYSIQEDVVPPTRLMNFAELLSQYKIKYIVKDKQSSMDGIESVKSEISHNLNTLIIDTLEYVKDWENSSYFDLMEDNCTILKKAL